MRHQRKWMANRTIGAEPVSIAQLVACARAYQRALRAAFLAESGESDEANDEIVERMLVEIAGIDAPSIENENWIWVAIADEFRCGM